MKKNLIYLMTFAFAVLITFSACKKEKNEDKEVTAAEVTSQSEDQAQFSSEMDAVANDIDVAVESNASISGRIIQTTVCDASMVLDSTSTTRTLSITYNATGCGGTRARTGQVVISMAKESRWKNAGTAITVTLKDLKVVSDGKSITINGSQTITNVSGGKLIGLAQSPNNIIHTLTSDGLTITFNDGTKRVWNVAKKRTYSYSGGIVVAVSGTHEDGLRTGIAEWGTDRFDREFSTQIAAPLVIKQDCSFRLVSGKIVYTHAKAAVTITFGLDVSGIAIATCPAGTFYLKAEWLNARSETQTFIKSY